MQLKQFLKNQFSTIEQLSILLRYPYMLLNWALPYYSIPVLVYHKITERDYSGLNVHIPLSVSYASFNKQMEYLNKQNCKPLSIQEYIECVNDKKGFPDKSVLITFDDGYKNVQRLAYAALKKYSFPAVVFVACEYIGTGRRFPGDEKISLPENVSDELMPLSWEQIKNMEDLVTVGSHTLSHPQLACLSQEEIHREVNESKRIIEQETGKEVLSFAYPGGIRRCGAFSDLTREQLIDAGYKIAFNSEIGRNRGATDPYLQNRIAVEERDSLSLFQSKLVGAYDWCRIAQWAFQRVFRTKSSS
jgi:peptidoglycan/xylan/chitin deacetylase (PgdA/CDA1 family)